MPRAGLDDRGQAELDSEALAKSVELVGRLVDAAHLAEDLGERSVFMAVVLAIEILDPSTADDVRWGSQMLEPEPADPDEGS